MHQIPSLSGIVESDSASTANSLMERDASNDSYLRTARQSGPSRCSQGQYTGVSASKTIAFSADDSARVFLCDTTAAAFTATLPAAATSTGLTITFVKTDASANQLTIKGNAAELINAANTYTTGLTSQYGKVTVTCDGTKWYVI